MFVRYNHNKSPLSIWFIRQSFSCSTCHCIFTAWGMNCLDSSIIWSLGQTFWKVFKLKFFQIFKLKLILTWLCHNSKYIDSWLNVDTWSTQPFKNNRRFPIFFSSSWAELLIVCLFWLTAEITISTMGVSHFGPY